MSSSSFTALYAAGWLCGVTFVLTGDLAYGQCSPGSYSKLGTIGCHPADPGYYVPKAGATSQIPSGRGYYVPDAGSAFRIQAVAGTYAPNLVNILPTSASPGFFVATDGADSQTPAPAGFFVANEGQISATPASPGYYVPTAGSSSQTPSGKGFFVPTAGASSRIQAVAGTFAPFDVNTSVLEATPGYYVPSAGADSQTPASPGTYVSQFGATEATPAPVGHFVAEEAQISATPASPGYYVSTAGSSSQTPAESGFHVPSQGSTAQTVNPPGTWSPAASAATRVAKENVVANGTNIVGPVTLSTPTSGATIDLGKITEPTSFSIALSNTSPYTSFESRLVALSLLSITPSGPAADTITLPPSPPSELAPGEMSSLSFVVTPTESGEQTASVVLQTDRFAPYQAAGEALTYNIIFEVPAQLESYLSWSEDNFTLVEQKDPSISGTQADPDKDGLNNLLEYGLGLHPKNSNPNATEDYLPTITREGADIFFDFSLPLLVRGDLTYRIQTSTTLMNGWKNLAEKVANSPWTNGVISNPESGGRLPYRLQYTETPRAEKRFFRLYIEAASL